MWNSDDSKHTFRVTLFDADGDRTFERTAELEGTSEGHYASEVVSGAPDSAGSVRAAVGGETAERELSGYENPVLLSVKFNAEHQLAIVDWV